MAADDKYGRVLYCGFCHNPCEISWEDVGIGPYEFWGAPGCDVQWEPCSHCCSDTLYIDADLKTEWDARDYAPDLEGEI
jgi:hypothetical protein